MSGEPVPEYSIPIAHGLNARLKLLSSVPRPMAVFERLDLSTVATHRSSDTRISREDFYVEGTHSE